MDITEIRLRNVEQIITHRFGGVRAEFARNIDREPPTIGQWFIKSKNKKNIGHRIARHIEQQLNIPKDWLDQPHEDYDLDKDHQKKHLLKSAQNKTYDIPLRHSSTLNQQYQLSIINNKKGKLMILSTDGEAYAFQLIGHNPHILLTEGWGLIVEPGTPLAKNEYALIYLKNGEILLRRVTHLGQEKLLVSHPISNETQELSQQQIEKAVYCYIGIPPSKIIDETPTE